MLANLCELFHLSMDRILINGTDMLANLWELFRLSKDRILMNGTAMPANLGKLSRSRKYILKINVPSGVFPSIIFFPK
jgi:hypothetical protein